jgi:localization factor PodJL
VSKNPAEAYKWYLLATRDVETAKRAEAQASANRVKAEISAEAQQAAERFAGSFAAQTGESQVASAETLAAQQALGQLGYYQGALNGAPSAALSNAIREYQRDQGLQQTGSLDAATATRLEDQTP